MKNYNYYEAMKSDILDYLYENPDTVLEFYDSDTDYFDTEGLSEQLNDELWIDDSVTGNGSGSYTFNSAIAKEYVADNDDLLRDALREFCVDSDTIAEKFLNSEYEYFDVTIRCYILYSVIYDVVSHIDIEDYQAA